MVMTVCRRERQHAGTSRKKAPRAEARIYGGLMYPRGGSR